MNACARVHFYNLRLITITTYLKTRPVLYIAFFAWCISGVSIPADHIHSLKNHESSLAPNRFSLHHSDTKNLPQQLRTRMTRMTQIGTDNFHPYQSVSCDHHCVFFSTSSLSRSFFNRSLKSHYIRNINTYNLAAVLQNEHVT